MSDLAIYHSSRKVVTSQLAEITCRRSRLYSNLDHWRRTSYWSDFQNIMNRDAKPGPSAGQKCERFTVLTKSLKCVFVRIGRVARSRISLRISGSATAMPLLIYASGFSQMGRSDSYSIFAMGTCEFTDRGIPIGVPIFLGRSFPGPMVVTSSPIELQRHP